MTPVLIRDLINVDYEWLGIECSIQKPHGQVDYVWILETLSCA